MYDASGVKWIGNFHGTVATAITADEVLYGYVLWVALRTMVGAVPFLLYMYVAWAGRRMFGWRLPQLTLSPRAIGIFLAVWGVWSVLRNLPWAPFTMFYV